MSVTEEAQANPPTEAVDPAVLDQQHRHPTPDDMWKDDPDEIAHREALAQVAAEEAAKSGNPAPAEDAPAPAPAEGTTPTATPAVIETVTENPDGSKTIMVPKARLDAVLAERDQARNSATYFQSIADARKGMTQETGAPQGASPQPTPQAQVPDYNAQIAALDEQKLTLADKYEAGELTAKEWKQQELELDRQARALQDQKAQNLVAIARQAAVEETSRMALNETLNQQADRLEAAHPYAAPGVITAQHHWDFLEREAATSLEREGLAAADTPAYWTQFRERVAQLTDIHGPAFSGKALQLPKTQAGSPAPVTASLPQSVVNRMQKMEVAAQQPPTTAALGTQANVTGSLTDSEILGMSEDQLADHIAAGRVRTR